MARWQVHDAKRRLSELIELAQDEGPQMITRHGKDRAVVLSVGEFRKLEAAQPDFKAYLLSGPKVDDLEIERPPDSGREVEL
jgi:prevent-host-death family protein